MTWVIGTPTILGYGILMADIQATISYADGRKFYYDCIQKVFPIGKSSAAAFCGDIKLGYFFMRDLMKTFHMPDENADRVPDYIMERHYTRRAKWLYNNQIKAEFRRPVQLMVIAAQPARDNGIPGQPQMYGCILKSPNFEVEIIQPGKLSSIGSGNDVKGYIASLDELNKEIYNPMMQFEVGNQGGYGTILQDHLRTKVRENETPGISKHFLYAHVTRRQSEIRARVTTEFNNNGVPTTDNIPSIESSWSEFERFIKQEGHAIADLVADA